MSVSDKAVATMTDSLTAYFSRLLNDARAALCELSKWERAVHVFWLAGPFILLIERSPADFWLSVLALTFVARSIVRREGWWLRKFWVRAAFLFWGVCLLAAALSSLPIYSLGEALAWFRFPLFAMATAFWLGRDRRLLYLMILSTGIGMVVMCGILTAEILIVGPQDGRLSWPYGDVVPGSYLAKASLPPLLITIAFMMMAKDRSLLLAGAIGILCLIMVLMTGERINFLIATCGAVLAIFAWRPNLARILFLVGALSLTVLVIASLMPEIPARFVDNFLHHIPTHSDSAYFNAMMPGILAFEDAILIGIGPGTFRDMCTTIIADAPSLDCHPHPHNFYIQMAGETGIFGLVTGVVFIGSLIWACAVPAFRDRSNVVVATMWIVPFGLFWPIASTADFFGQWNNIFMWSAIAVAIAGAQIGQKETFSADR
jgi:O-antigen ligase